MRRAMLLITTVLSGCGPDSSGALLAGGGPLPLASALAYLDPRTSSLVLVDPASRAGPGHNRKLWRAKAGEKPVTALSVPRSDDPTRQRVLVVDPVGAQVLAFSDESGSFQPLSIDVPLEALDVSADGRWGIAYEPDGATPSRSLFAFPNTVAVLDLDGDVLSARALRLGSAGARPKKAVFATSMKLADVVMVDGVPRNRSADVPLAFVFVQGGLVPVDLKKGVAGPLVPLTPDASRDVVPAEVLFTNNQSDTIRGTLDGIERAFVRSTAGELYVLAVSLSPTAGSGAGMDVNVALENVVTPDATVYDAELYFAPDGTELLLAAAGNELVLVNGYTGVASRLAVDTFVDTLVRFVDPESGVPLALGYGKASPAYGLLRLDPLGLMQRRSTGLETVRLGSPIADIAVVGTASRAVVEYQDSRDLGVLELTRSGDVLDLRFAQALSARSLSPAGDRLWLVSLSPDDNAPYLAEVALGPDLTTRQVRLDADGSTVGAIGDYLWVDHADPTGAVTFFPKEELRREAAIDFVGVLYTDLVTLTPPGERTDNGSSPTK